MAKSRDAFRTISEVSDVLDTPAHVLRFWESKFKQIKPVKRAGGRRYYRPDDLALLASIKDLLHEQGHSIKNAQKLIRDTGVKTVVEQGHAILGHNDGSDEGMTDAPVMPPPAKAPAEQTQTDLFAGSELPESTAPVVGIDNAVGITDLAPEPKVAAFARRNTPAPETKTATQTAPDLPDVPRPRDDVTSRILATLVDADPDKVLANAAKIAPLADRLAALRDEMRHPW